MTIEGPQPVTPRESGALDEWFAFEEPADPDGAAVLAWRGRGDPLAVLARPDVRAAFDAALRMPGAVLVRGLPRLDADGLQRLVGALTGDRWARYREPQSPRRQLSGQVFTSTEHPASQRIHCHNENAHCMSFPQRIYFFCHTPAAARGATPFAGGRAVGAALSAATREAFAGRGVRYWRTFGFGMGFDWRHVFGTQDRDEAEAYFRANEMGFEWVDADRLRVWYARPAFVRHPETGEDVWCNNIAHYHPTSLEARTLRAYRLMLRDDEMPFYSTYGDGEPIPAGVLEEIRAAYASALRRFDWRPGDFLALDNILFSHGRETFEGGRQVFVAMTHPVEREPEGPLGHPALVHPAVQGPVS